jgi:hypothetical protein
MKIYLVLSVLALLMQAQAGVFAQQNDKAELLLPVAYIKTAHPKLKEQIKDGWLEICKNGTSGKYMVKKAVFKTEDIDNSESTGNKLLYIYTQQEPDETLLYVKGVNIMEGEINGFQPEYREILPGHSFDFDFNGITYTLSAKNSVLNEEAGDSYEKYKDYKLYISRKGNPKPQLLLSGFSVLNWAGDLDRDGKADLIFKYMDHSGIERVSLFLSSKAADGELLKKIAAHEADRDLN